MVKSQMARKLLALVLLSLVLMGCLSSSGKGKSNAAEPPEDAQEVEDNVTLGKKDSQDEASWFDNETRPIDPGQYTSVPIPTPEKGSVSIANISIDYLYTTEIITIIYHLYGSVLDNFLTVTLTNDNPQAVRIEVMSEVIGYTTPSLDTIDLEPGESVEVYQNPRLEPKAIDQLNAQHPAQFHIQVTMLNEGEKRELLNQTHEILVFGRRDFPWDISGFERQEVLELFAAMVTPHDPAVEELLRAAADYHPGGLITGAYSGIENDAQGKVWDRLKAVYDAQANVYNLTYINTWVSYAPGSVQRIRMPADVLEQHSGNCIELALLYASACEAMDLESAIILIPGHAFPVVRTDMVNAKYYAVEATMVGRASFEDAVAMGTEEMDDALMHLDAGDEGYGWITIATAREKGILPIPWR